eukprot:CAMPEP_0117681386 /NCGR_PEP_ID=MMETSP0804-20121206/18952_1 /TAXON_ID=1074897 /ORGANISM="Tetraselmis astigmatica, Strain CCMP880" /LENGTH=44 /DNA_ID= /DNA_START= /DNA_END= /DNA_ORIENTATION=
MVAWSSNQPSPGKPHKKGMAPGRAIQCIGTFGRLSATLNMRLPG